MIFGTFEQDGGDMYIFGIEASTELSEALGRRRSSNWGGGGACNGGCASYNDCIGTSNVLTQPNFDDVL